MVMKNLEFPVDIIDIALPNDYGVAKKDGRVIFIPGAVVADRVTVKVSREYKKFAYGEITHIDVPSPYRVPPECPHFGSCGGCTMQHLRYDKQLEIKQRYLSENLGRIGSIDLKNIEVLPVTPSPDLYFYRNKLEFSFGEKNGEVVLGLRERLSPFKSYTANVVPVSKCPVFSPVAERIVSIFAEFAHTEGFMAFNPLSKKGVLKHLVLRESKSTGEIMVIIETRTEALQNIENVVHEITQKAPEVTSFYHATNRRTDDIVHFERIKRLFGTRSIIEKVSKLNLKVYPQTFFQPNTKGANLLYNELSGQLDLKGNETILGLYSGSGPIEIFLSKNVRQVIGIDSEPANISTAKENCKLNQIKNCTFYQSRAEDVLKKINIPKADVLVMDPPRTGLSKQGLNVVKKLNLPKVAYISCNPATLARDLRELCGHGYAIHRVTPFDLFPHTGHLETLVILKQS
jgi:23S rRNA (uracil1939-C5)-methyltransferase